MTLLPWIDRRRETTGGREEVAEIVTTALRITRAVNQAILLPASS